jgi:uncharacterized protein YbjT (DUF2867 family)/uncharacterized membrane protein YphA (DoxX/SURF4 family)
VRILLTGATGFVGQEICEALLTGGHRVRAVARHPEAQAKRPGLEWISGDFATDHDAKTWTQRLEGVDAVVNAVGIIRERGGSTFQAVHGLAPRAMFDAAAASGISRVVQISAMGVDADGADLPYQRTKAETDRHLLGLDLSATVLRPSLILGERGQSARLFRQLAALPVVPIAGTGDYGFRPIHVADLARAVLIALEAPEMPTGVFDLGGHQRVTLKELLLATRAWLGERPSGPCIHVPLALIRPAALIGDLSGRGPIDSAMLRMLQAGADDEVERFEAAFGFQARGVHDLYTEFESTEAVRLEARLDPWRTPIRLLVASIWLITPVVTLAQWDLGIELLAQSGFGGAPAPYLLVGSCVLELVLAACLLLGRAVRAVGWFQIALMVFYSIALSFSQAEMWLDPFGPLAKNLPLIAATLAMIALAPPGRSR